MQSHSKVNVLETLPSAVLSHLTSLPRSVWNVLFYPAPAYISKDVPSTKLLFPLAYFGVLMGISLFFAHTWLFTIAALGFVWVDGQMAMKIHETYRGAQKRYNALVAESAENAQRLVPKFINRDEMEPIPLSPPIQVLSHKDYMTSQYGECVSSGVCVLPAQDLANRFSSRDSDAGSDISDFALSQAELHSPRPLGLPSLKEDEPFNPHCTPFAEAIHDELFRSISYRRSIPTIDSALHDSIDDDVSDIISMEELDFSASPSLSPSTRPTTSSGSTSGARTPKREHAFPSIHDVLETAEVALEDVHPLNLDQVQPLSSVSTPDSELSSQRDGIFSPPLSRASSISVYSDDDEVPTVKPSPRPCLERSNPKTSLDAHVMGITRPIVGMPKRAMTAPTRKPKKNNGWKSVPTKARRSKTAKRRFMSKAFW